MKLLPLRSGHLFSLVDLAGRIVVPAEFQSASASFGGLVVAEAVDGTVVLVHVSTLDRYPIPGWTSPGEFSHGFLDVTQRHANPALVGYANRCGDIVVPPRFRNALPFDRSGATVETQTEPPSYRRINRDGEFMGESYWGIRRFHSEGLFCGARVDPMGDQPMVLIDGFGERIGPYKFQTVWQEHEGLIPVEFHDDEVGWIDTRGRPVYRLKALAIGNHFESGLVPIKAKNRKWGLMDVDGRWQLEPEFDVVEGIGPDRFMLGWRDQREDIVVRLADSHGCFFGDEMFEFIGEFKEGIAQVWRTLNEGMGKYCYRSEFNYINYEGKLLLPSWN